MFKFDTTELVNGLTDFEKRAVVGASVLAENGAKKLENHAKEKRKWTDRTAQARQRLNCTVDVYQNGFRLCLAHGVEYGVNLELGYQKRYAIIMPTIEEVGETEVMPAFNKFINNI